jgi:hypothetical protein
MFCEKRSDNKLMCVPASDVTPQILIKVRQKLIFTMIGSASWKSEYAVDV